MVDNWISELMVTILNLEFRFYSSWVFRGCRIINYFFADLVPVTVKENKKKGRGSVTDQDSIKTEDIEKEYRKVLVQPGSSIH